MSCAKIDPALHQAQKPPWIKVRLPSNPVFFSTKALISDLRLHTVCESAQCPNRWECWSQGTATMMIAGDRCTRACGFCAVTTAKPFALEEDEPQRVAEAVRRMKLKHVVITAVARDDLKDGGANHFARVIAAIREMDPSIIIEVLVPDFHAQDWCIQIVLDAAPDIYNHNMETVERLTPLVRSRAKYRTSLQVLRRAKELSPKTVTKSGVMLGLGETEPELFQTMDDLREVGCQVLTMGQYLRPTPKPFAGGRIHHAGAVRSLRRDRAQKGIRACRLRSARAQLVSRGRLSSGRPLTMERSASVPSWTVHREDRQSIAAVIPAYQEEKHIGDVVRRTRAKIDNVLVVDDGSRDKTAERAREAGAEVIVHPQNRGKGESIKTGLRHWLDRQFTWVFILDADGQHRPEEIDDFIRAAMSDGASLLLGNRMKNVSSMPLLRRVVNRYMSNKISRVCGQQIPDTQCGLPHVASTSHSRSCSAAPTVSITKPRCSSSPAAKVFASNQCPSAPFTPTKSAASTPCATPFVSSN